MAGRLNVAVEPNARLHFHVVLPSSALRSRKDAVPDFPHQAGHHLPGRNSCETQSAFGDHTRTWRTSRATAARILRDTDPAALLIPGIPFGRSQMARFLFAKQTDTR